MLELIRNGIKRLTAILKGSADQIVVAEPESKASRIPVGVLATPSNENSEVAVDLIRWTIT